MWRKTQDIADRTERTTVHEEFTVAQVAKEFSMCSGIRTFSNAISTEFLKRMYNSCKMYVVMIWQVASKWKLNFAALGLLGCYVAYFGRWVPMFRDKLYAPRIKKNDTERGTWPSTRLLYSGGQVQFCPETSVNSYQTMPHNNPEER